MMNAEVGKEFPLQNTNPKQDYSITNIEGSSFHIRCYMTDPSKKEIRSFKSDLLRLHIYIEKNVPFIILSWLGSPLAYDCTLALIGREKEIIDAFLSPGNLVPLYLIDGNTNILHVIRAVGLEEEAERMIKVACRKQLEEQMTNEDIDAIRTQVYQKYPNPVDMLKHSVMFEYKGQR